MTTIVLEPFVTVRNLTKRFGALVAVDDVSLAVGEGHTLALLGPSGCGKTTILRCIAGLETPEQGHISIAGTVAFDSDARHRPDAGAARARRGVPVLRGVAAHDGGAERRLSAQGAQACRRPSSATASRASSKSSA